ncbi:Nucleolar protein 16 [Fulvia fulva]|uniref:Nucleolar protein 16 n=1 Tax=Passalora fulva TaxID=5499 RepID=A0A9Q8P2L6_PASFU|nr:Nucleolar protein 16 [Fulvia fulva]KAK4634129.1 Nucleolar protein 16 [Fulvia fulva]KAK4638580.1 Nucleolar protein 16 [Fulvia fulva]UJO11070.1 Nucleolar protein 16 [Fulvia fulva]WPV09055.1 Nucleolar protein 16 [Fulvia fulva]WPV23489.1 Nucleolar protein 16 [Fulvia fulva]
MGRELQKKKNRSGINKVRQKPKSKKKILTNPIIAENWDKSQSLAQNYTRLGLTAKLNKNTGGVERKVSDVLDETARAGDALHIANASKRKEQLDVSEAKIERDPETGKILRVLDDGRNTVRSNPLNDPLNHLDSDDSEDEVLNHRNQHATDGFGGAAGDDEESKTETVRRLEEAANRPAKKFKRRMPDGEVEFVEELVRKYGDDYGKMARDHRINYMQRSEGDIKKRIKKWRENGGTLELARA